MEQTPAERQRGGALEPHRPAATSEDLVEAEIDREVDDSFPASDPPGWTLGTDMAYRPHAPSKAKAAGKR